MQDYFTRRQVPKPRDFEAGYWGVIVDPDGNVRNRLEERERYLEDIKQERVFLNSLSPGRILDVGCGLGYLLSGLRPGWEKHGTEVSRFAARHAGQWGKIFVGDLADAHYPAEYFDVVVFYHVIEHMESPLEALVEIRRLLKRGGILLLGTPDFDSGCARRFGEKYRMLHDATHINLFTNDSMHRCLRDHGFVIDRVAYPFFETRHFTAENLLRLFDTSQISPPFYGNFMTFYCHKPDRGPTYEALMELSRLAAKVAVSTEAQVTQAGDLMTACLLAGHKVLVCGNGGSAADAQHFVAELVGRMRHERQALAALSLQADPSVVTALSNDYGYEHLFARQVEGLGQPGDVLVAVSTSGRSANILRAIETARQRGLRTLALVGAGGEAVLEDCDVCIRIPSPDTQRIQELHTAILHAICDHVERHVSSQTSAATGPKQSGE